MIGSLLQPEIEELIRNQQWDDLREALAGLDPSDIAELILDLPEERADVAIFRILPRDSAATVFSYLPPDHQENLLRALSNEQMRSVLAGMSPDDQARLIDHLPAEVTRRLLEVLSPDELSQARDLLGYPPNTAGRFMTPKYVALFPEMTAEQALAYTRQFGRGKETLNVLYIVDRNGILLGDVRLGAVVTADSDTPVPQIEGRPVVSIPATMDRQDVVQEFRKYDRSALPVVDDQGHMLGIITVDDVLDVAEEEATEDIQKIGGMEALDAPYNQVGFFDMLKKRGGWLAALFLGETLTATAMGHFEKEIARAAVVALFVPLIISSGGNSGSQATSIIIRALALRELKLRDWWWVFGREIASGFALGAFLGAVGFLRILLWNYIGWAHYDGHPYLIATTVWLSLIGVVTFGSLVGAMLPFILRRLGLDPATASAPFVATLVDVTGLVIYFTVALLVLHGTLL
jgi:magnesium transporter